LGLDVRVSCHHLVQRAVQCATVECVTPLKRTVRDALEVA
jgi:hypothetical protein